MKNRSFTSLFIISLHLLFIGGVECGFAGYIKYPGIENLDIEEGTIEIWCTATDLQKGSGSVRLFEWDVPGGFDMIAEGNALIRVVGQSTITNTEIRVNIRRAPPGVIFYPTAAYTPIWKSNELHHVALTWKKNIMNIYHNGVGLGGRTHTFSLSGMPAGSSFYAGCTDNPYNNIIVHAMRISSIARQEVDFGSSADPYTLVEDVYNQPPTISGGATNTIANVISGLAGETGGKIKGAWRFINDPINPGIFLSY